jgi:oxygen-independent coproporphyrinogen-3 oxidase
LIWIKANVHTMDKPWRMDTTPQDRTELTGQTAPRYTSYPPATSFGPAVDAAVVRGWMAQLRPGMRLSLYLHIPFCERLCWFCACRTQGTRTRAPVDAYLRTLEQEIRLVAGALPAGLVLDRVHLGGGTPTILAPDQIDALAAALAMSFGQPASEFSVEIDPTCVDADRIAALGRAGMTRASIGIQDFHPAVQQAIGRNQSPEQTRGAVDLLRRAGVAGINADLVYGLPHQTPESFDGTLDAVIALAPDRVALFGYAHVPWMARRQQMIPAASLPGPEARGRLIGAATDRLAAAGYQAIGIDHFAKASDGLAMAAAEGRLRRNFQGYTDDGCDVLIGLGASAISRFPQGFAQNAAATANYQTCIRDGSLAVSRGFAFSLEDRLRGRAIEMLMCDFRIDLLRLAREFGSFAMALLPLCRAARAAFPGQVELTEGAFSILPDARPLVRLIAMRFDAYAGNGARHSAAV